MLVSTQMTLESANLINHVANADYSSALAMVQFANAQLADHSYILYRNKHVKDAKYHVGFITYMKIGDRRPEVFVDVEALLRQGERFTPHIMD